MRLAVLALVIGCTVEPRAPAAPSSHAIRIDAGVGVDPGARDAPLALALPDAPIRWCIDEGHCKDGVKRCLDVCYKYNHPNGPKNDRCDRTCRETYCDRVACARLP